MNNSLRLALLVAGVGVPAGAGIWAWAASRRRRRRTPDELERLRRGDLCRGGRIAAGVIVDTVEPAESGQGPLIIYKYQIAGVTYEAAQDVSALPGMAERAAKLLGEAASVKYDPYRHTDSIIAGEEWCGIADSRAETLLEEPVKEASD